MLSSRGRITTARAARRRREVLARRAIASGALGLLFLSALVGFSRIPAINIKTIIVTGAGASTEDIKTYVAEKISGSYLFLFPKSNIVLYPRSLNAQVLAAFPRVAVADVGLTDLQVLQITVKERTPAALWCGNDGTCYFLDESGLIFAKAPAFEGDVFLRFFGALKNDTLPIGERFLSSEEFKKLIAFAASLSELNLTPRTIAVDEFVDVRLTLKGGAELLFSGSQDLFQVRSNLESVLTSSEYKSTPIERIEYIDLRFGNKVYLKEK